MSVCDTLPMRELTHDDHPGPWTEAEYLALAEISTQRIELIDGDLWVSPWPADAHNDIAGDLRDLLKHDAHADGLRARLAPKIRLASDRIVVPDFAITKVPWHTKLTDPKDVLLVCEVTSPSNAANDRIIKRSLYAEAKIEWYLLIEPDMSDYESLSLQLLHLEGDHYVEHVAVKFGETLQADLPFSLEINTKSLLRFI